MEANSGVLIFPINNEALYGNIRLCYLNDRYLGNAARQFINIAREVFTLWQAEPQLVKG